MCDIFQEYLATVEEAASAAGLVAGMVESMTSAIHGVVERGGVVSPGADESKGYVDYQTNLVRLSKQVAATAQDMTTKSMNDVLALGPLAQQLTHDYCDLAQEARGAASIIKNPEVQSSSITLLLMYVATL